MDSGLVVCAWKEHSLSFALSRSHLGGAAPPEPAAPDVKASEYKMVNTEAPWPGDRTEGSPCGQTAVEIPPGPGLGSLLRPG